MCFAILSIKSPCGRIATIESKLIRLLISLSIDLATPGYWTFTATLINTRDTRDRFSYPWILDTVIFILKILNI